MKSSYQKLIEGNRHFAESNLKRDPDYFKKLMEGQKPDYLWIGCSDSRVPANEITNTGSGEIFVHRNIANLVVHTDINMLSVLEFALKFLKVRHVIVCGHYGCSGIRSSMSSDQHGFVDNWLCNIKDVYYNNREELDGIADQVQKENKLCELNVIEQVHNLAKTSIVQQAWKEQELEIHGWVYGLHNGLIKDLAILHNSNQDIDRIYRFDF